jgi:hypothetical protein
MYYNLNSFYFNLAFFEFFKLVSQELQKTALRMKNAKDKVYEIIEIDKSILNCLLYLIMSK